MDYLTWTYFYRRLVMNPSYYHLDKTDEESVNLYLSQLVEDAIWQLAQSGCVTVGDDGLSLVPDTFGRIASYYYLDHKTLRLFGNAMHGAMNIPELLKVRGTRWSGCRGRG
jgi:activating signal cointegrator complex subunit 3